MARPASPRRGEEHRRRVLLATARAIHSSVRLDRVFATMARHLRMALPVDQVLIALADASGALSIEAAVPGDAPGLTPGTVLPPGEGAADIAEALCRAAGFESVAVAPIRLGRREVGLLGVATGPAGSYDDEDRRFLALVAEQMCAATANAHAWAQVDRLTTGLREENARLREALASPGPGAPIGVSRAWLDVLAQIERAARSDATVLITGETGTGKEVVARQLHRRSARAAGPFHAVNCAALPPSLIGSELFGHERGAFTGALRAKPGRFELAAGGTLLLDEIGEMAVDLQAQLLRVLQEREVRRLGGERSIPVNVRVVAATNRDPGAAVAAGILRADLYFRLNVVPIHVPPLRARPEDVEPLLRNFVHDAARRAGRRIDGISPVALAWAQGYAWPGNVRELQNLVERGVVLCAGSRFEFAGVPATGSTTAQTLDGAIRAHIEATLRRTAGRIYGPGGAAELLGLKPSTLQSKCRKLGIQRAAFTR